MLRDVVESDLDAFFEHQRDPEGVAMALVPSRERAAFDEHWQRLLANDDLVTKTIVHEGRVAGNALSWAMDGRQVIGYWLGREFWGQGLATRAVAELVEELSVRPLHAWVATSNVASRRVLEKCGFVVVETKVEHDERLGRDVEVQLLELA
jgi:RimJ/RimL family protein N-acetyltransferase